MILHTLATLPVSTNMHSSSNVNNEGVSKVSYTHNKQEMSLKKTNGVRLKKGRKYNTRLGT